MANFGWKVITILILGIRRLQLTKRKKETPAPLSKAKVKGKGGTPAPVAPAEAVDALPHRIEIEHPQAFAKRLGLNFKDGLLLSRALTHRSYLNEHPEALEDNERLEFLGDAVLDFVSGAWLYNRYPEMPEGDLTRMRSALVFTDQLAKFARKINLGGAMRLGRGEVHGGGRDRAPILCDTFEALVGALYLDQGLQAVLDFVFPLLEVAADEVLYTHRLDDPKSMFQEWAQSRGFSAPRYVTRSTSGPDHSRLFEVDVVVNDEVYGTGSALSKHLATKLAARNALNRQGLVE